MCHKKCNSESVTNIKDMKCASCSQSKKAKREAAEFPCKICKIMGAQRNGMHFVCKKYKKTLVEDVCKCAFCYSEEGGMIKCVEDDCEIGVHPFCQLTNAKSLISQSSIGS